MKATRAAPSSGVVAPGLAEDQRRQDHRHQNLDREHHRRDLGRRPALQRAHLAEQGEALRGDRGGEPGDRDEQRARRELVGEQLAGDRRPGVAEAGADDRDRPASAGPAAQR